MDRIFIAFILCLLSTLHASEPDLNSPIHHYQNNCERVHKRIQDAQSKKADIQGQAVLHTENIQALTNLKRKIKHLKREEKRLLSLQIN